MSASPTASDNLPHLRVLEVTAGVAAAFSTALLSDFGADTVVCEGPPRGSLLRDLGPADVRDVWWSVLGRNKRSVALDLDSKDAPVVLDRLKAWASIVVDSVPDGDRGADVGAPLTMHIYPTGADRPGEWGWSTRPELAGAATGAMTLTGWADGPPTQPEFPLTDYTMGMFSAAAAMLELRASQLESRSPAPLSFATHEALMRLNEWQIVIASGTGRAECRTGNRLPMNTNVGSIFKTRDGKLLTVSAATQDVIERLIAMVGGDEAARDPRFRTLAARKANMDALEEIIADWMRRHDLGDAMDRVLKCDVVAGPIFNAADIEASAQVKFRNNIVTGDQTRHSQFPMPSVLPQIGGLDAAVKRAGPTVGGDTDAILRELNFSDAEVRELRRSGAIWS
jgi:crotonobetainyl-CoA:carnitine CoA-transferase CaiB-like acyl-CoA transferase